MNNNLSRPELPEGMVTECIPVTSVDQEFVFNTPNQKHISPTFWTCAVCLGVPRNPVMLRQCGHIGCGMCMRRVYNRRFSLYDSQKRLPDSRCPVCRTIFLDLDMVQFEKWEILSKGAFSCVEVSCPKSEEDTVLCNFVGSIQELREHELRVCEKRVVKCPNPGCQFVDTHAKLREHFRECKNLVTYCDKCKFPTVWSEKAEHQCIAALRNVIYGNHNLLHKLR